MNNDVKVKRVLVTFASWSGFSNLNGFLQSKGLFFNVGLLIYTKECINALDNISKMDRCV
jgi:hypothetical protein